MTFDECLELAAQAWCKPETQSIVVDPRLAKEFAKILYQHIAFSSLKASLQKDHEMARGWHANMIACCMHQGVIHDIAQRAASEFMKSAFDVEI